MWIKVRIAIGIKMNESNENQRRYKWPWFVLAAVLVGIVLAVVWVGFAVKKVERERNFNAPPPNGAPAR
jgi:bacteriorhodopsin